MRTAIARLIPPLIGAAIAVNGREWVAVKPFQRMESRCSDGSSIEIDNCERSLGSQNLHPIAEVSTFSEDCIGSAIYATPFFERSPL
jgi:hypothetical protein